MGFDNNTVTGYATIDPRGLVIRNGVADTAIEFTGVETSVRALDALTTLRSRLEALSAVQGDFGALESRLQSSLSVIGSSSESTAAAESRIRDIDVAEESANLLSSQIRQQAGAAVLTQANSQPQLLLFLLES